MVQKLETDFTSYTVTAEVFLADEILKFHVKNCLSEVYDFKEKKIHKTLIELGWTPPPRHKPKWWERLKWK